MKWLKIYLIKKYKNQKIKKIKKIIPVSSPNQRFKLEREWGDILRNIYVHKILDSTATHLDASIIDRAYYRLWAAAGGGDIPCSGHPLSKGPEGLHRHASPPRTFQGYTNPKHPGLWTFQLGWEIKPPLLLGHSRQWKLWRTHSTTAAGFAVTQLARHAWLIVQRTSPR